MFGIKKANNRYQQFINLVSLFRAKMDYNYEISY
jgi:hypothetical protein